MSIEQPYGSAWRPVRAEAGTRGAERPLDPAPSPQPLPQRLGEGRPASEALPCPPARIRRGKPAKLPSLVPPLPAFGGGRVPAQRMAGVGACPRPRWRLATTALHAVSCTLLLAVTAGCRHAADSPAAATAGP